MKTSILAGALLALSPLAPMISSAADVAPVTFESGALQVEQLSNQGPPIVFIPGLASGSWTWRDSAARLGKTHSVYLLTLPGFDGRAPIPGANLDSLSKDLRTLIETRKLARPVLVGHSLGGTLSLSFAAENSALLSGVIAVDGLPVFPGTEGVSGDRSALAQQARSQLAGLAPGQFAAYQQTYMGRFGVIDAATASRLAELSGRSDPGATADFAAQLLMLDLRPKLPAISVQRPNVSYA